jgi:hypothetical protein
LHAGYERDYAQVGAVLAAEGVPYRIDEMNSCYNGGARDSSDTYASTLWALDCTHWWAAHHILGVNYHTGESVGRDGHFGAANYAAFVHQTNGVGFNIRPQGYAYLAFTQGARGTPLGLKLQADAALNFDAYAYQDTDGSVYVTLINKSFGEKAQAGTVTLQLPHNVGAYRRMDLAQKDNDIAARTGISLGGAGIDPEGVWSGRWKKIKHRPPEALSVEVAATSATILHFPPGK